MKYIYRRAFTLVELLVVIGLISILSTLGMLSYYHLSSDARDAVRFSDINNIVSVISITEIKNGEFPRVVDPIQVTFEWDEIWQQWTFWKNSYLDVKTLSNVPVDPLTGQQYTYSLSKKSKEFQVWWIFEAPYELSFLPFIAKAHAKDFSSYDSSIIRGTYNGRFLTHTKRIGALEKQIFILGTPSIISRSISDSDIKDIFEDTDLVFDGKKAIPWTYRKNSDLQDENWEFTPDITEHGIENDARVVVYEGSNIELSTTRGKQELVKNLQSYYENTDIRDTENIQGLLEHTNADASNVVDSYINGKVGWLHNAGIKVK